MSNREPGPSREVLDEMLAALEASRKSTPTDEQSMTESTATLGVRGYRNGYRAGWNDALSELARAVRGAISDSGEYREVLNSVEALKKT